MPSFECRQCYPGCYLEISDEDTRTPEQCPWKGDEIEAVWKEVL